MPDAFAAAAMFWLAAQAAGGGMTAEQVMAKAGQVTAPARCDRTGRGEEIVVCARRAGDRYRVPGSTDGGAPGDNRGRAGEVPGASPERLAGGPCGIFAGERRCGKAEAKLYGYDGKRNPISVLVGIGEALLDPE